MSYLLLVDTAIQGVAVGLTPLSGEHAGDVAWSQIVDSVGDSARLLPIAVESGLAQCSIAATDVVGIVITAGPGSFTGLRVGLAYAMGFAAGVEERTGREMRWLGSSSLSTLASYHAAKWKNRAVFVALGATKTNGYAAYISTNSEFPILTAVQNTDDFSSYKDHHLITLGDWPLLEAAWPVQEHKMKIAPVDACFLTLNCYAETGLKQWPTGFKTTMPGPNYLRKSTVEEKEKE